MSQKIKNLAPLVAAIGLIYSANGAANVGYFQDGAGAVIQKIEDRLRINVWLTDFKQPEDGDDYKPAFQRAYEKILTRGLGTILVPDGEFHVETKFTIATGRISIKGSDHTKIISRVADGPAIQIGNGATKIFDCNAKNLSFANASGVIGTADQMAMLVNNVGQSEFYDIEVGQYPAKLSRGLKFVLCSQCYLDGLEVQDVGGVGVAIERCNDLYGEAMRSDANGIGWQITDTNGIYFANVSAYSNDLHGWVLNSDGVLNNNLNHFYTNCVGDSSGQMNWLINQLEESSFVGSWGSTQKNPAAFIFGAGFYLDGPRVRNIKFSSTQAIYNNQHGFHIEQASEIHFASITAGSESHGNGRAGFGHGIYFGPLAVDCTVKGGDAIENHDYGISIHPSATKILVYDLEPRLNGVGPVEPGSFGGTRVGRNIKGFTPLNGSITTPAVSASGATLQNTTGHDCQVSVMGGTVSAIYLDGAYAFNSSNIIVPLRAGASIRLDYTAAPIWQWLGQ